MMTAAGRQRRSRTGEEPRMRISRRYEPVAAPESERRAEALCTWLRDYASRRINSRLIDERRCIPPYVALDFGNQGIFGMQVEERWGGLALRSRGISRVLQQASAIDLGLGTFILTSLFPGVRPIASFGSPALKQAVLRDLATGRSFAGYAQTEPGAGTHFPAMSARALLGPDGRYRVSGDKIWIGNATWAAVVTVMAHTVEGERRRGLDAFAVPTDAPGVVLGRELLSLGMRGMVQSEISFRDVAVDEDALLAARGQGLDVGVDSMCFSRFAIAATCVGAMKHCAQQMLRFASRRSIATGRLLEHPVVLTALGETSARIAAAEAVVDRIAELLDAGGDVAVELFAVAKVAASEFLWASADRLVQVLGSRGYDESNRAPQLLRDARVTRIFEGTSEALVAYLGQQALSPRSDLHTLLREPLAGAPVADALAACVARVRGRTQLATGAAGGGPVPRSWQLALLGHAAVWAVVLAALRQRAENSELAERARAWAAHAFESACAQAADGAPEERLLLSPAEAEKAVEGYTAELGDVEQTLPGAKEELDPLLRPTPPDERG